MNTEPDTAPSLGLRAKTLVWNAVRKVLSGGTRRRKLYKDLNHLRFLRREGLLLQGLGLGGRQATGPAAQSVLEWRVDAAGATDVDSLRAWLGKAGIKYAEGGHTIYLPPQDGLAAALGDWIDFYPAGSGFKILKDLRGPQDAHYLTGASRDPVRIRLVGSPADQVLTANYLFALGIGPRVHDLCSLRSDGLTATVFVVEHVEGRPADDDECAAFLVHLKGLLDETRLSVLVPYWEDHMDFQPPGCNGNLVVNEAGAALYVDFQNFGIPAADRDEWKLDVLAAGVDDLHFGQGREERGERYLYQAVPGVGDAAKRDIDRRWTVFREQLGRGGVELTDRVVMDVGCNAGMILHAALAEGAVWGLGWDLPNVARHTEPLLLSLGMSRFTLTGAQLGTDYDLRDDIPEALHDRLSESVLFYLAVHEHIGVLPCLSEIPWRALVFEGHQGEEQLDENELRKLFGGAPGRILMNARFADGDCTERPVAVLVRD